MRRRLTALFALVAFAVLLAPAASATVTPSPTPTPTTAGASPAPGELNPRPEGAYVGVTLVDSRGPGNGTPVPGVTITVTDSDKTEVGEQVTDERGQVFIAIPSTGTYRVTLDTDTLPDGIPFSGSATRTIEAQLAGGNFAQFQIGVAAADETPFSEQLRDALVSGVKFGLIVALAALGLSLIFGTTKLTNFSHGELITFGAIATYVCNRAFGMPVILAGVCAVLVSALFGYLQDRLLWRPLRSKGIGIIAMMIVSIGFGLLLRNIFQYTFGGSRESLTEYVNQARVDVGPFALAPKEIAIILVAIAAITIVCVGLLKTRLGKAMRAVSDNPALAASSGMRVDGVISSVWILGTALTGLSGVLLAVNSQVNFLMGYKLLLLVFAGVTLGGLGTIWGALVGSMVIGILTEVGPLFGVPQSIKEVGALVVLILILLVRPQGILGKPERIG